MWPFNTKQTLAESGLLQGLTDCHCHILPNVDNGVKTRRESLDILAGYELLGIEKVWLTPHVMSCLPYTTDDLRANFEKLKGAYRGKITLCLSAEYMLDNSFMERLRTGDLLPWGNYGNHLLVETDHESPPDHFYEMLESIQTKGMSPILAHPECYQYMNLWDYRTLKEKGIEFQLNLFSLFGVHGKQAKANATFLLKNKLYDYVGTDLHSPEIMEYALHEELSEKAIKRIKRINFWAE